MEIYAKYTIRIIDLFLLVSEGKRLPRVIEYNGIKYTNISNHNNIIYIAEDNKNSNVIFKKIFLYHPTMTDMEYLNSEVTVLENF